MYIGDMVCLISIISGYFFFLRYLIDQSIVVVVDPPIIFMCEVNFYLKKRKKND